MNRRCALIARRARDQRGTSVVELGLIMPILFVTLVGVVDCARLISAKLTLQQAAERTAEMATAGGVASTAFTALQAEAATAAAVSTDHVTVTYWLECDGTRQSDFTASCSSGQQVARFTSISINNVFVPTFPWIYRNSVALTGSASVRVQ